MLCFIPLQDKTPLPVRDLSPSLLKCVEAALEGDVLEGVQSVAVGNLKSGLNRLTDPRGERGLSDGALKALDSASKMLETDANVKIVAELLLPLMKGFCVFNERHHKALGNIHAHNYGMFFLLPLTGKVLPQVNGGFHKPRVLNLVHMFIVVFSIQ